MTITKCDCTCPVGSGPTKTLANISGTYEDMTTRCCKQKICGCKSGSVDFGCVCFFCGPVPFSGTMLFMAGHNVWANYQGFCISAREDGTIIMNNLGATSIHAKVAPVAASMERNWPTHCRALTRDGNILLDANGQPTDWEVVKTPDGLQTYYWNRQTGGVTWEMPLAAGGSQPTTQPPGAGGSQPTIQPVQPPARRRGGRQDPKLPAELTPEGVVRPEEHGLATC